MSLRKTTIAVSDDLLTRVDCVGRVRRDAKITLRLNELFASPDFKEKHLREASELDGAGTPWTDESW